MWELFKLTVLCIYYIFVHLFWAGNMFDEHLQINFFVVNETHMCEDPRDIPQ